jgi:Fe-S cluster assembly iron-binding protein IscA
MAVTITEAAGTKIREFIAADGRADVFFRVAVEGGGCKGFSYNIGMDTQSCSTALRSTGSRRWPRRSS